MVSRFSFACVRPPTLRSMLFWAIQIYEMRILPTLGGPYSFLSFPPALLSYFFRGRITKEVAK